MEKEVNSRRDRIDKMLNGLITEAIAKKRDIKNCLKYEIRKNDAFPDFSWSVLLKPIKMKVTNDIIEQTGSESNGQRFAFL